MGKSIHKNFTIIVAFTLVMIIVSIFFLFKIRSSINISINLTNIVASFSALMGSLATVWGVYLKYFKKEVKEINKELLENHDLFFQFPKFNFRFKTTRICDNDAKNEVLKLILIQKTKAGIKHFTELAKRLDIMCKEECPCISVYELKRINLECIHQILTDYNNFYKNGYYADEEKEMIEYALLKFNKIHEPAINIVLKAIESIDDDFKYSECIKSTQAVIFDMAKAAYFLTFNDVNKTIPAINGFFDNKYFRRREY
jgi:hypothetical protein